MLGADNCKITKNSPLNKAIKLTWENIINGS